MLATAVPLAGATVFRVLALQIAEITRPGLAAEELSVRFDAHAQSGEIAVGRLRVGAREWRALSLRCGRLHLDDGVLGCSAARLELRGRRLPFEADIEATLGPGPARIVLRFNERLIGSTVKTEVVMTGMPGMADHPPMTIRNYQSSWSTDNRTVTLTLRQPLATGSYELRWQATGTALRSGS